MVTALGNYVITRDVAFCMTVSVTTSNGSTIL